MKCVVCGKRCDDLVRVDLSTGPAINVTGGLHPACQDEYMYLKGWRERPETIIGPMFECSRAHRLDDKWRADIRKQSEPL